MGRDGDGLAMAIWGVGGGWWQQVEFMNNNKKLSLRIIMKKKKLHEIKKINKTKKKIIQTPLLKKNTKGRGGTRLAAEEEMRGYGGSGG